jgi:hypothetical protein
MKIHKHSSNRGQIFFFAWSGELRLTASRNDGEYLSNL